MHKRITISYKSITNVDKLIWDEVNTEHIRKHDVSKEEVEEALSQKTANIPGYRNRIAAIGLTSCGRVVTTILEGNSIDGYYVVTARPSSRKERKLFNEHYCN
jgi:uncharacterized DUF497 family protein